MRLVFVGGGRFAAELHGWMASSNSLSSYSEICFIANSPSDCNLTYLGSIETAELKATDKFILAVGSTEARSHFITKLEKFHDNFISYIHPSMLINAKVKLGIGFVGCPFTLISFEATVGNFALLNCYSSIGHDCKIGDNLVMSPYSALTGNCTLGKNVYMGTHSSVIPGLTLGDNCKISAGSVAMKNVKEGHIVIGNMGQTIKL